MTNTRSATLMIQGTTSDAGKSVLVAGFCRCLKRMGYRVVPFKPQNMALNSAVTADGGEIGRAQALQAQAAGVEPHVDMNPVLLKPSSDTGAQVIIHGKAISNMQAQAYHDYKKVAMQAVLDSHQRLSEQYQVIMVEGAGSPAEINLREGDIANMGFAEAVDCPVIIVADIDKGGVFAHLVGTLELLSPSEQNRVVGFVINKFRGDIALLQSGLDWLEARTNKPVLGVLPYLMDLQLAEEDAIQATQTLAQDDIRLRIVVPVFSRISNHTDFDMLRAHPQLELTFVRQGQSLPATDLIILPGSKHVRADLDLLKQHGWDKDIAKHLRYGGKVLGICGGYQMLGQTIHDPTGIEGTIGTSQGLGYLPINTTLQVAKQLTHSQGTLLLKSDGHNKHIGATISGYQIHVGNTEPEKGSEAFSLLTNGQLDGCVSTDNQVAGSYLHGMFDSPQALQQIIAWAGADTHEAENYTSQQEHELDRLADTFMTHLDWQKIQRFITDQTDTTNKTLKIESNQND
ncbi:cobyric acid synthase [Paraglaciecola arctica]|uniref:Cobyric acid synthase n=1 Tax=Paraglaciecola arctica BSs20135 TaxID=493475 RepID=K6ZDQ1_9ALTE|nr:cobyric acid synthase [Paraglaciecola arctica]GAC21545.1 cobyric acid synthase [Paraglaciecola arctica BSs20135]